MPMENRQDSSPVPSRIEEVFTKEAVAYFSDTSLRRCMEVLEPKAKVPYSGLISLSAFELMPENPEIPDAVKFVESCFKVLGMGFHPDTPFQEYVTAATGESLFSEIDAIGLNWQISKARELLLEEEEDAYDICERLAEQWLIENQSKLADDGNSV
jgi:hypothetical protein